MGNIGKVSVLLPTRGRYVALQDSLYSLSNTIGSELINLLILVDNERESYEIAKNFDKRRVFNTYNVLYSERRLYSVKAFCSLFEKCNTDLFVWVSNTIKYRPDWLLKSLNFFKRVFPDSVGVLSLGGKMNKANFGMSSKKFVEYNEGEWFSDKYKINFCDDELTCRAILLGRYFCLENSGVVMDPSIIKRELLFGSPEEKRVMKVNDRTVFYDRSEHNFYLPKNKIYEWKGFRNIFMELKG